MRKLDLELKTVKFLENLPAKQYRQLMSKILSLLNNPRPQDSKLLTGYSYYRTDVGEYRIIYFYDDAEVKIVLIGHRNDDEVYKQLKRKQ